MRSLMYVRCNSSPTVVRGKTNRVTCVSQDFPVKVWFSAIFLGVEVSQIILRHSKALWVG